jgi:tetratricopeptide (TPR) repeat protein
MRLRIFLTLTMAVTMASARFLGQAPAAPDQQRQSALALEQQGKNSEAEDAWRLYLKAHPSSPEPYAHLGLLEARQEHFKQAVPLYRKALALGPAVPTLRMNLGLALFKSGELKQSIVEFQVLLKSQQPGSTDGQRLTILIGMAYYGLAEYAKAVPFLKQAAANDKQNLPLRLSLAHSCLGTRQYQCVLDTYHEILTLNAESAEADMLAGEALNALKDDSGAIEQFRAAVKADPKQPDAHFALGYLLWMQKQYAEAVSEFQAELDNNPNHVQAMLYLGDAQMELKHPEIAQPLLEEVLRIDPGQEMAHLDLGIVYADTDRKDDALKQLKEAERMAPEDVNVHWRLGRLYRSMGRKDESKFELDKASSITKATDSALVDKISGAHAKGAPAQQPSPPEK